MRDPAVVDPTGSNGGPVEETRLHFEKIAGRATAPIRRLNGPRPAGGRAFHETYAGRGWRRLWLHAGAVAAAALAVLLFAWLTVTAPLSQSLRPRVPPSLTLLSAEGRPIAHRGPIVADPVSVEQLPQRVWLPVLAIEDRRFLQHWGVDPLGLARAAWRNLRAGGVREGGSTITQQLAKRAFLTSDRSLGRKLREVLIAFWLEARLSKAEILSRYLSTAYFGDNVYGLRAAAHHYFDRPPEALTVEQAAMLAGLVKAPSRLNPIADLDASQARARTVVAAMVEAGMLGEAEAARLPVPAPVDHDGRDVPTGTYFADWIFPAAREAAEQSGRREVQTTLERGLQRLAWQAIERHRLGGAQVALVAMRPDGSIAAMVGGRSYRESPFNRVTQARRSPGSTFKLFVYLAALRAGYTPDTLIDDWPIRIGNWSPSNHDNRYRGVVPFRTAFALSSNVAAARLAQHVGMDKVVAAARDLGVTSPLEPGPSLALGASDLSLLELTSAYAAMLSGAYPVRASGLAPELRGEAGEQGRLDQDREWLMMLDLLWSSTNLGTGRAAALGIPTFGKTGTSQDHRDALYVGFAGDLVVGVWVGHDDNRPLRVSGGGLPAQIWHDYMSSALRAGAIRVSNDSRFQVPRFRYVPATSRIAEAPAPLVRRREPPRARPERRREADRWQRWEEAYERDPVYRERWDRWRERMREWESRYGPYRD